MAEKTELTDEINDTIREGLTLLENSIKRMQSAKPKFKDIYDRELAGVANARAYLLAQPKK